MNSIQTMNQDSNNNLFRRPSTRVGWNDLDDMMSPFGDDLKEAVIELGWTEDMWDGTVDQIAESDCLGWMSLSSTEQWAIAALGYTAMKWDLYPVDPRCPEEGDEEGNEDYDEDVEN